MKIFDNLSKKTKTGVLISIILCVLLLSNSVISIVLNIQDGRISAEIKACLGFVMAIIALWYVLFGFKQPHGNSLRVAYFIFALYIGLNGMMDSAGSEQFYTGILMIFAALIVSYISGRLNKIEKNRKLLIIVGLLLLAYAIIHFIEKSYLPFELFRIVGSITPIGFLVALYFAYTARYEQHKMAGLEDK